MTTTSFKNKALAHIRAQECIGCAKCLDACPFDAILGASQYLHTVLTEACVGCGLCIAPCPVDCIEMYPVSNILCKPEEAKRRVIARKKRLRSLKDNEPTNHTLSKLNFLTQTNLSEKASYVEASASRVRMKRMSKYKQEIEKI